MHLLEEDCILHEPGPFSDVMDVGDSCVARSRATRSLDPPAWWKRCFCWASRYSCSARKPIGLTRAPMGYSRPYPPMGGPFRPPPSPAICHTAWPILDPKTAFDSSRLELSEYFARFYVTDDFTDRVKGQTLIICPCWLRRCHAKVK